MTAFDGEFLVLEMASITCPLFQSRRDSMATLVTRYPKVAFAILYVREAHPGALRPEHTSDADKRRNALALKNEDGEGREIWLDSVDGAVHTQLGQYPNSVFIINKNGCIVFMSDWNNPRATGRALAALTAGKPAGGPGMFLPAKPSVLRRTLKSAGAGAAEDFRRGFARLVWGNLIKRNLRVALGEGATVGPDATC